MKRRKLLTAVVGVCLAAGLVAGLPLLSGCGGGAAEETPIKIGAPDALTGYYAADGILMLNGTIMAAEEINAEGGLLGRQLEVVPFDVEDMMAEKVMAAAEKLIGQDKVDVVLTSCNAAGPDVEAFGNYDIPYMHFNAVTSVVDLYHADPDGRFNVFMVGDVGGPYGAIDFDVTQELPYQYPNKKLAVIKADYEWDIEYANGFRDQAIAHGWEIVMEEVVPYGTSEWGSLLVNLRQENPSLIVASFYSAPDLVTLFNQWSEQPTDSILCFGYGVSIPEFADMIGEAGNGICGTAASGVLPTEEGMAWAERYEARFDEEAPKNASAGTCYDEVMAWAEAVNRVGDVGDYRAICTALDDYPHQGVTGVYDFDGDHKVPESEDYPQHFFQMQDGNIATLYVHLTPVSGAAFELPPWLQ